MNTINRHAGPCWYCGIIVRRGEGVGRAGLLTDAVWHSACVGSNLRYGRSFYDKTGKFTNAVDAVFRRERSKQRTKKGSTMTCNRNPKAKEHESGREAFFAIWCPTSTAPIQQTYDTADAAFEVADEMARRTDGCRFIVMQAVGSSCVEKPVVRRDMTKPADA